MALLSSFHKTTGFLFQILCDSMPHYRTRSVTRNDPEDDENEPAAKRLAIVPEETTTESGTQSDLRPDSHFQGGKACSSSRIEQRNHAPTTEDVSAILAHVAKELLGPFPSHSDLLIDVHDDTLDNLAGQVHDEILLRQFPTTGEIPPGIITRDEFITVIRYIFHSRIDHVYSNRTGRRTNFRIPMTCIEVPKAIALCINSFGIYRIMSKSILVCPKPTQPPEDKAKWLTNQVSFDLLSKYGSFVSQASQAGWIRVDTISRRLEGTAAWLLRLVNTFGVEDADWKCDSVRAMSSFPEWSPHDGVLAIVMNCSRYWDILKTGEVYFRISDLHGVIAFRATFTTEA